MKRLSLLAVLAGLQLGPHTLHAEPIIECEAIGNARPICGFSNPEDIVALPGDQAILIGEYGASAEASGVSLRRANERAPLPAQEDFNLLADILNQRLFFF